MVAAGLCFPATASAQTAPIRIMPLGDSITDGSANDSPDGVGGYRGNLYSQLTNAGYNVDYIGSMTINSSLVPDPNHEGHSGWRIDQLDSNMATWLSSMADPDVVLMHIGTNDFGQNLDITNAINRLDALILNIATLRPYAHIIVTNLMERGEPANTNIQTHFNPFVEARVNAHAAAGRRVTFLDMRAVVPLVDMPDNLHPNQTGYNKMADAWMVAIQAIIGPDGDNAPPALARAVASGDRTHVTITFSKPVADSAATLGNFSLGGGLAVNAAELSADKRSVILTTSEQAFGGTYTATVNGVVDRTLGALALPSDSTINFNSATPRGYLNNVPESAGYTLACSLDIPTLASYGNARVPYSVDNRQAIGPFSRIAYYLELQTGNGDLQYVWASVDAFTQDVGKIGVPTLVSGAVFQQNVSSMNVVSNVPGIITGGGLSGNIEFWPTNYSAGNAVVPSASGTVYDFGDTRTLTGNYGSMQLHNTLAGQTVFAFNNWGGTGNQGNADVGIGNDPAPVSNGLDWTFHHNAATYVVKTLQVLVQTTGDIAGPTLESAVAAHGRTQVIVRFSEPLAAASVTAENFSLDAGVSILGITLAANLREVTLLTTSQPTGTPLTLTVSGVRDSSASANLILPASTIAVVEMPLPPEIVTRIGAAADGYQLVASIDIPVNGNFNASNSAYLFDDRQAGGNFAKVAYYLETQKIGQAPQYVWASMDAFTLSKGKLGIPTLATGAVFQQNVTNLDVRSNVAGIVTGTTATGGNIEFWPNNYTAANALAVPNASATLYDTGDTRSTTTAGHGCMQVHNHDAGANQTVFAINRFGLDGLPLDLGIGNNPAPTGNGVDWTHANNAGTYYRRILHVLVLPGSVTPSAVAANIPEAADYQLIYSLNLPAVGNLVGGTGFTNYANNFSADAGAFSRVAYYMELQKTGDTQPRYVWTSMDAFTANPTRIAVPTAASGAVFQQTVANMNVLSNVPGIVNGSGIATGNIEFWPNNYTATIPAGILPGNPGSTSLFDFNDTRSTSGAHGTMQVHNHAAGQTLFALNNWGTSNSATNEFSMGIGNNPNSGQNPDYTLNPNGNSWDLRRVLHVFILPTPAPDATGPTLVSATPSPTLARLVLAFDEAVAPSAAAPANFSIPGLTVTGVTLLEGNKEVAITTSTQTSGSSYTVNVTGVRDRSPAGNFILPGASIGFTAWVPPAILANVPETTDYKLVYQLAIPSATPRWNFNSIPYSVNEAQYGGQLFDRVAYLLELDGDWAYASFDRHTGALSKVGIPTIGASPTPFQQIVTNLNVASNVGGIATGTGITTGNIEFWGGDYSAGNSLGIPNASGTVYDFGDAITLGGGHGTLQIHNHAASQTILSYTNWGSSTGQNSGLGIGNNPNAGSAGQGGPQGLDWTFSGSASNYSTRNLHVLVRPGGSPEGPVPVFQSHPVSRSLDFGGATTLTALVTGPGPFTYQWWKDASPLPGENLPWLVVNGVGGSYHVVVTGSNLAQATSLAAVISVGENPFALPPVITLLPDDTVNVLFHGTPGQGYRIYRSINLSAWQLQDTMTADESGNFLFHDPDPPEDAAFYRASKAP